MPTSQPHPYSWQSRLFVLDMVDLFHEIELVLSVIPCPIQRSPSVWFSPTMVRGGHFHYQKVVVHCHATKSRRAHFYENIENTPCVHTKHWRRETKPVQAFFEHFIYFPNHLHHHHQCPKVAILKLRHWRTSMSTTPNCCRHLNGELENIPNEKIYFRSQHHIDHSHQNAMTTVLILAVAASKTINNEHWIWLSFFV